MNPLTPLVFALGLAGAPQSTPAAELPRAEPSAVGLKPAPLDALGPALDALAADGKVAGGVALVARDGKVVYSHAFGKRDLAAKDPMPEDAIFAIASMTKPVTCVAAMILVEEGKIGLDDPVAKYIPALAEVRVLGDPANDTADAVATVPLARPLTVRHLFTHTAGFTYGGFLGGDPRVAKAYQKAGVQSRANRTIAEQVDRLAKVPLAHQPGDAWTYGLSHDVLGRVVEVASGETLAAFMAARIFRPLGLSDTAFEVPASKRDRMATIYNAGENGLTPLPRNYGSSTMFAGGAGLFSTARDYARFASMLAGGGALDGVRILKAESVDAMTTNQIGEKSTFGGGKYGLGFGLVAGKGEAARPRRFSWCGLFSTNFWVDPGNRLVAVLLTQQLPTNSGGANDRFEQAVAEALGDDTRR